MEALEAFSPSLFHSKLQTRRSKFNNPKVLHITSSFQTKKSRFVALKALLSDDNQELTGTKEDEKFDWYTHWYPVMPVCELDKRRPQGKKVVGIDLAVWFDRNENAWKVFDDMCPHRLAPLSEGRIDQWGRLQCVYHGWCFGGSGDCKFIPQAPRDGPPIHTSSKACATVYPSCVQNGILWFWPNADPQYKDILSKEKPPFIEEIDDPSYTCPMITRDIKYGYEVLIENFMDPAHVAYAHYGIMRVPERPNSLKADREGGVPLDISIKTFSKDGFTAEGVAAGSSNMFIAPCVYYSYHVSGGSSGSAAENPATFKPPTKFLLVFMCIPVSPGNSRLIFLSPRNFGVWIDRVLPPWIPHLGQNLLLDSDLNLLHVQEQKIEEIGPLNWNKACFVPAKADAIVVAFRRWLSKYSNGQVDWGTKCSGALPPTPSREQLLDRYWTHTVSCKSCNAAYKGLNVLEIALQVLSVLSVGVAAAAKHSALSVSARYGLVSVALLFFVASKWLSNFVYKNFHYHDYDHAFQ